MNCGKMEVILKININRIYESHLFILSIFVITNSCRDNMNLHTILHQEVVYCYDNITILGKLLLLLSLAC